MHRGSEKPAVLHLLLVAAAGSINSVEALLQPRAPLLYANVGVFCWRILLESNMNFILSVKSIC